MNAVNCASAATVKPKAAVLFHPTFQMFGIGSPSMKDVLPKVGSSILMVPCANDPPPVQEGGEAEKVHFTLFINTFK